MKLYVKIATSIFLILVVSTGLITVFNYLKFEKTLGNLVTSQISVIGTDVKDAIEAGLSLGLSLPFLHDTQAVIDRANERNPLIRSITVFELGPADATTVFDTERDQIGLAVSSEWHMALQQHPTDTWTREQGRTIVLGLPLVNSFNKTVGAVVLQYDRTALLDQIHATLREMAQYWLVVLGPAALITVCAAFFFFRSLSHSVERMTAAAQAAAAGQPVEDFQPASALETDFDRFLNRTSAAGQEIERLERDADVALPAGR